MEERSGVSSGQRRSVRTAVASGVRRKGRVSRDVTGAKSLQLSQETRQQAMQACLTAGRRSGRDGEGEGKKKGGRRRVFVQRRTRGLYRWGRIGGRRWSAADPLRD